MNIDGVFDGGDVFFGRASSQAYASGVTGTQMKEAV
jgi:hypothetical protein